MPMTVYRAGTVDKFNKKTWGTGTDILGRFRRTDDTITTKTNEIEPINGVVIVKADVDVERGDKITYNGSDYRVMTKLSSVDGKGQLHHIELKVQEWNV